MSPSRRFFYRQSGGIRITVRPTYMRDHSRPELRHYVFAYQVRIENVGPEPAQLLRRRWLIHDSIGEENTVEGEGVIGETPSIEPGNVHEYQSYCVLKSPNGYYYFWGAVVALAAGLILAMKRMKLL